MTSLDASIAYIKNNPDTFGRDIVTAIIREGEAIDALAAQGKTKEAGERAGALLADLGMIAGGVQLGVLAGANALKAIGKAPKIAGTAKTAQVGGGASLSHIAKNIHPGRQGKHVQGHNDYIAGRSFLYEGVDPQKILSDALSGEFPVVGYGRRGQPIVDFGVDIGVDNVSGLATRFGAIHSGNTGAHIVSSNPTTIIGKK